MTHRHIHDRNRWLACADTENLRERGPCQGLPARRIPPIVTAQQFAEDDWQSPGGVAPHLHFGLEMARLFRERSATVRVVKPGGEMAASPAGRQHNSRAIAGNGSLLLSFPRRYCW